MGFDHLTDILRQLQARFPQLSQRMREAESFSHWEEVVGPAIAKHAQPVRVQDGVLWVEVDHPIWQSELHHRKRQILEKLNAHAKGATHPLSDILFLNPRERAPRGAGERAPRAGSFRK